MLPFDSVFRKDQRTTLGYLDAWRLFLHKWNWAWIHVFYQSLQLHVLSSVGNIRTPIPRNGVVVHPLVLVY